MSDFVIKRRRSRYTGPVDPCLGYYASKEQFVPSSVPSEIELELELNSSQYPCANMDFGEDQNSEQQEETGSIIDADWSVLASYMSGTTRQHRGHPSRANHDPELSSSDHLTVDGFLKQNAKINLKNIKEYGKQNNKVSSDGRNGPRRRYRTLRRVQASSDSPSSRVKFMPLGEPELRPPRSNLQADEAFADGSSSDFDKYSPSIHSTSSPLPSPAHPYHGKSTNRHRNRTRKKRKPLRVRLYAAISTHVDPEAAFAQAPDDPETRHRLPLRFLPEPSTPTNVEAALPIKKVSNWSLIDPRKSRAIDGARFPGILRPMIETGLGSEGLSNTLDRLPIDSWRWDSKPKIHSKALSSTAKKSKVTTTIAPCAEQQEPLRLTCEPLTFVPLTEAHQLRRKDRRLKIQKQHNKQAASASGLKMVPIEGFVSKIREPVDENQTLNLQPVQLPAPSLPESQGNIEPVAPANSHLPSPTRQSSAHRNRSEPHTPIRVTTQPDTCSTKRKVPPMSQLGGLLRSSTKRKILPGAGPEAGLTPKLMPTSRPCTESKPLKPLVAFMDQFLENLRSVSTQIESGASPKKDKAVRRPASRRRKDFGRSRISGSSTVPIWEDYSPEDKKNDHVQHSLMNHLISEPSGSRNELEFAGPDLSTLLEREQGYSVLLSSPSS